MSGSVSNNDRLSERGGRRKPRHIRRKRSRQPIVAALLGVLGLAALLAYTALGVTGAAATTADTRQEAAITLADSQVIHVKASTITDARCGEGGGTVHTGVFFVITDISHADAPTSVHVFWDNGTEGDAPLVNTPGNSTVAQYSVNFPAGVTGIKDATAVVPAGWDGQFNVSHYLCGPAPSESSTPSSSSSSSSSSSQSSSSSSSSSESSSQSSSSSSSSSESSSSESSAPSSSSESTASSSSSSESTAPSSSSESTAPSSTSTSTPPASTSTFVPGAGQTGDSQPPSASPLKKILLGVALALFGSALALSAQQLRRRGSHS